MVDIVGEFALRRMWSRFCRCGLGYVFIVIKCRCLDRRRNFLLQYSKASDCGCETVALRFGSRAGSTSQKQRDRIKWRSKYALLRAITEQIYGTAINW